MRLVDTRIGGGELRKDRGHEDDQFIWGETAGNLICLRRREDEKRHGEVGGRFKVGAGGTIKEEQEEQEETSWDYCDRLFESRLNDFAVC